MAIEWVKKGHAGHGFPAVGVLLSRITHNSGGKSKTSKCLLIRLGKDVMKECRFVAGDRVRIGVDKETHELCIERTLDADHGWTLSPAAGKKTCKQMHGSCVAASFRVIGDDLLSFVLPNGVRRCHAEYTATTDGLIVSIPKPAKS